MAKQEQQIGAGKSAERADTRVTIRRTEQIHIFFDSDSDVDFEILDANLPILRDPKFQVFASRLRIQGIVPTPYLTSEHRRAWKRIEGEALYLALIGAFDEAEAAFIKASEYVSNRAIERARLWYIWIVAPILLIGVVLIGIFGFLVDYSQRPTAGSSSEEPLDASKVGTGSDQNNPGLSGSITKSVNAIQEILIGVYGGVAGAGFSLLTRLGKMKIDPAATRLAHQGEAILRLLVGALAASIILMGIKSGLLLRIADGAQQQLWLLALISVAAGWSERFVPSFLSEVVKTSLQPESPKQDSRATKAK